MKTGNSRQESGQYPGTVEKLAVVIHLWSPKEVSNDFLNEPLRQGNIVGLFVFNMSQTRLE